MNKTKTILILGLAIGVITSCFIFIGIIFWRNGTGCTIMTKEQYDTELKKVTNEAINKNEISLCQSLPEEIIIGAPGDTCFLDPRSLDFKQKPIQECLAAYAKHFETMMKR